MSSRPTVQANLDTMPALLPWKCFCFSSRKCMVCGIFLNFDCLILHLAMLADQDRYKCPGEIPLVRINVLN